MPRTVRTLPRTLHSPTTYAMEYPPIFAANTQNSSSNAARIAPLTGTISTPIYHPRSQPTSPILDDIHQERVSGLLRGLSDEQHEAVIDTPIGSAVLVTSGPGSGKTRCIVGRVCQLVSNGVNPSNILCITYTKKATREMASRLDHMIGEKRILIRTFHSLCYSLLRRHHATVGLEKDHFTIVKGNDQFNLMKSILLDLPDAYITCNSVVEVPITGEMSLMKKKAKEKHMSEQKTVKKYLAAIRSWKERGIVSGTTGQSRASIVYSKYQHRLKSSNSVDFADLQLYAEQIFRLYNKIADKWRHQYIHVLVDEFQDTNPIQFELIRHLAGPKKNIYCVGDFDQSIFGFRGATVEKNFREFLDHFGDNVKLLCNNFRSTTPIVSAASFLISHADSPLERTAMISEVGDGPRPRFVCLMHPTSEAAFVAKEIKSLIDTKQCAPGSIAVLYRLNILSLEFEYALKCVGLNCTVSNCGTLYSRTTTKNAIALMQLAFADEETMVQWVDDAWKQLDGLVNPRILRKVVKKINGHAIHYSCSLFKAAHHVDLDAKERRPVQAIMTAIRNVRQAATTATTPVMFLRHVFEAMWMLRGEKKKLFSDVRVEDPDSRVPEVEEEEEEEEHGHWSPQADMQHICSLLELDVADQRGSTDDRINFVLQSLATCRESQNRYPLISLGTIHSAKGLEWDAVFFVRFNEKYHPLPHQDVDTDEAVVNVSEERRLVFVALTRCKRLLCVSFVKQDRTGENLLISRYMDELNVPIEEQSGPDVAPPNPTPPLEVAIVNPPTPPPVQQERPKKKRRGIFNPIIRSLGEE